MKVLFSGWRGTPYRSWRVGRRFWPGSRRYGYGSLRHFPGGLLFALALVAGSLGYKIATSPWPLSVTLRHIAAAPNCDAARRVGLAPARAGQPGYYPRHDADNDGIACEPWPRRRR